MSETWKYASLEWIHRVREENYKRTRTRRIKDLVGKTDPEVRRLMQELGLAKVETLPRSSGKRS